MRRVLLINPWIDDIAAYDLWAKPLGLLGLGALLRRNHIQVSLIDCLNASHPMMDQKPPKIMARGDHKYYRTPRDKPAALADLPRQFSRYGISREAFEHDLGQQPQPDAILVTSRMTYWYTGVHDTIGIVKKRWPDVPVILGGIYATLCPEHAKAAGADHIISGEGELKVLQLLSRLWNWRPPYVPDMHNLDSLPYPCFDLLDELHYVCLQTTRGCPYRCSYCASHLLSDGLRRRDPTRVIEEIKFWRDRHGVRHFAFYDDALLHEPQKLAVPLFKMAAGLEVKFHCPNALHIRHIDDQLAALMMAAGVQTIRLGFEFADEQRQQSTGGKVNNRQFVQAVASLQRAGYQPQDIGVYILCGIPGQSKAELLQTINFVHAAGASPIITEFSPIPGSAIFDDIECQFDLDDPLCHNNSLLPCRSAELSYDDYEEAKRITKAFRRRI